MVDGQIRRAVRSSRCRARAVGYLGWALFTIEALRHVQNGEAPRRHARSGRRAVANDGGSQLLDRAARALVRTDECRPQHHAAIRPYEDKAGWCRRS